MARPDGLSVLDCRPGQGGMTSKMISNFKTSAVANTIPELSIDPEVLHRARRKLQTKKNGNAVALAADEREALLQLISRGKRRFYPSQQQIDQYHFSLDMIGKSDPQATREAFKTHATYIKYFEDKYCK